MLDLGPSETKVHLIDAEAARSSLDARSERCEGLGWGTQRGSKLSSHQVLPQASG